MNSLRDMKLYLAVAGISILLILVPLMVTTDDKHKKFEEGFLKQQPVEVIPFKAITFTPPKEVKPQDQLVNANADNDRLHNVEPK